MSAKTRYYLEQSIPELEDLEKKGLFTKKELNHIIKKRTDFEHRISSRGSKTRDYLKYIEFEKNLEKLRSKRYARLSSVGLVDTKPSISDWSQQRRILFIFDRSVQKFPSEFLLWEGYLEYAKKEKLFKKIYKIYTELLQLHPTSVESWINAASFEFDYVGSAKNARILFQKGLRFNSESKKLWLSYLTFELNYITKLISRRKLLGLVTEKQQLEHDASENQTDDIIELPNFNNDDLKSELNALPDAAMNMLGSIETNPALKGDVALTIYDIMVDTLYKFKTSTYKTEFQFKYELASQVLRIMDQYDELNREYLCNHVISRLLMLAGDEPRVIILDVLLLLKYSDDFVDALQISTKKYLAYKNKLAEDKKLELKQLYVEYLTELIEKEEEENTKAIMKSIIKKL